MTTKIYHNPRCSKSREALQLLKERGIDFQTILYLDEPPQVAELTEIIRLLGVAAQDLVRRKEKLFRELSLQDADLDEEGWINVLAQHPRLMERPIVIHKGKAAIGRPSQQIEQLLEP